MRERLVAEDIRLQILFATNGLNECGIDEAPLTSSLQTMRAVTRRYLFFQLLGWYIDFEDGALAVTRQVEGLLLTHSSRKSEDLEKVKRSSLFNHESTQGSQHTGRRA